MPSKPCYESQYTPPVKVIKRPDTAIEQLRRHALGLLKELVEMYPCEANALVRQRAEKSGPNAATTP